MASSFEKSVKEATKIKVCKVPEPIPKVLSGSVIFD